MSRNELTFGAYALPSYHVETDPPQGVFMRQLLDLLASAEPLGFDNIWLNEHHFTSWGGMLPSPPMALAALSQRTRHIRLGTSVAVLGLHHPIEIAEQMAMLDLMSGGRLEFGVGRGSAVHACEVLGIAYDEAQGRTVEAMRRGTALVNPDRSLAQDIPDLGPAGSLGNPELCLLWYAPEAVYKGVILFVDDSKQFHGGQGERDRSAVCEGRRRVRRGYVGRADAATGCDTGALKFG